MSKYDPKFWEVSVDPQILEATLIEPSFIEELLRPDADPEVVQEKYDAQQLALAQIKEIIRTRLSDRQRQIVEMYFYQRKSQQEIARELGINQQVVSKHLFGVVREGRKVGGAIKKIRKLCKGIGVDPKKWV